MFMGPDLFILGSQSTLPGIKRDYFQLYGEKIDTRERTEPVDEIVGDDASGINPGAGGALEVLLES